ncbi:MAG: hypothetical protein ACO3NW_05195 [Kiritimatiellia bacterium]
MHLSLNKSSILRLFTFASATVLLSSCLESDGSSDSNSITNPFASETDTSVEPDLNLGAAPSPVDPKSIPESGVFSPDPVEVLYHFVFQDGTQVKFREDHADDYWGNFPAAGFGQITWPDGRIEAFDANRIIRHGGQIAGNMKTPVTTLSHGRRLYWMADAEERKDVKKVTIFEDGWNPLVEGSMLATQGKLGITSPLVETIVTVEKRK